MQFDDVYSHVKPYCLLNEVKARALYQFTLEHKPLTIVEVGSFHGASAVIMAAALDELGEGTITTFDLIHARDYRPNVGNLADATGLRSYITEHYCSWCAEWELGKLIRSRLEESQPAAFIDFAFVDTWHAWTETGFIFCLLSRMINPGGWILFDDLNWTCDSWAAWSDWPESQKAWIRQYPEDARSTAMVRMVFDLLVRADPSFCNLKLTMDGDWGWAQKRARRE